jgi:hypothetical protein
VNVVQTYLLSISILSGLVLFGIQVYLKRLLRRDDDWFLLILGTMFVIWGLLALRESVSGEFDIIGRFFSIGTTALILISLRYFEDGIAAFRRYSTQIFIGVLLLEIVALVFSEASPKVWLIAETASSILAVWLLCGSIMVSFWNRKVPWMIFVPLVTLVALTITQLDLLGQEKQGGVPGGYHFPALLQFHQDWEFLNSAARMLSRPLLLVNVLLLTITWVGKSISVVPSAGTGSPVFAPVAAVVAPSPVVSAPNVHSAGPRIAFTKVWAKGIVVEWNMPERQVSQQEIRLTHAVGKTLYILARDRMNGTPTVTGAHSREFNNFSEELKRVLKALADEGMVLSPDDLIESAGTAKKAFKFKPEEIWIAEEVRAAFDHKTSKA